MRKTQLELERDRFTVRSLEHNTVGALISLAYVIIGNRILLIMLFLPSSVCRNSMVYLDNLKETYLKAPVEYTENKPFNKHICKTERTIETTGVSSMFCSIFH